MNHVVKTLAAVLAFAGMLLGSQTSPTAIAQSAPEPAAVISIANLGKHANDIDYLVDASGFGQMKLIIQTQINQFLGGIETTGPIGILLYMDEGDEQPRALGFMPVTNMDDILDNLSAFADVDEGDEFTTIITDDEKELLIKQVGNFAFFTDKQEMFNQLPDAPGQYLGDLPQRYNVSARLFGQRIPESLRQKGIDLIRDAYQDQLEQLEEEKPEIAEKQRASFETNMKEVQSLIMETDQFSIGMLVDQENKSLSGEFEFTGLAGSQMAKRSEVNNNLQPTRFGGFVLPGSAFNGVGSLNLTAEDIEQYKNATVQSRESLLNAINEEAELSDSQMSAIEKAMDSLIAAANETIGEGFIDSGVVVEVDKGNCNAAIGINITDPAKIEDVVKNLSTELKQELGEDVRVQLSADAHKNVTFHTFSVDTPADQEDLVDAVGEQLQVVIGIGKTEVYLAAGSRPITLLKKVLDNNDGSSVAPATMGTYDLFIAPILKFTASLQPDNKILGTMAEKMAEMGRDRLRYSMQPIKNGFSGKAELQDAVLGLIKVGVDSMGGGNANNGNGF